jgi:hypothetical protein
MRLQSETDRLRCCRQPIERQEQSDRRPEQHLGGPVRKRACGQESGCFGGTLVYYRVSTSAMRMCRFSITRARQCAVLSTTGADLRHVSVALRLAGLKLVLAVVEAGGASVAAEPLREHLSDFQERYIREWNE